MKAQAPGYIYFLHNPRTNLTKIGLTRWLPQRFQSLKGQMGGPFTILGTVYVPQAGRCEAALHAHFVSLRAKVPGTREWYHLHPTDIWPFLNPERLAALLKRHDARLQRVSERTQALGSRLQRSRLARQLSPSAFAHELMLSRSQLSNLEKGQIRTLTLAEAWNIADVLGMTIGYLFDGEISEDSAFPPAPLETILCLMP